MVFWIEQVTASLVQGELGHEGACPGKAVVWEPGNGIALPRGRGEESS